jgi:ABC-type phosphate transport system substrate-binding protein
MNRTTRCPALLAFAMLLLSLHASAEIAVVVHPSNQVNLTETDISRIYLGKLKSFPGGGTAIPLDLQEGSAERESFVTLLLNKSESQLKAYWSKLMFSGQGNPPKMIDSTAEMLNLVATNPSMIGFVDAAAVTDKVRVVGSF